MRGLRLESAAAGRDAAQPAPAEVRRFERRRRDTAGERLLSLVAEASGIAASDLLHHSRCESEIAIARQLAMYLMNVALQRSYTEVGKFFGRDRTTVSHACAVIEDLRDDPRNPAFERKVAALEVALCDPEAAETPEARYAAS